MNIGFWNVERLGGGTSDESKTLIATAIEWFFDSKDVELFVLCEITSNTIATSSSGTIDLEIDKIGTIKRRLKKLASSQLGYALVAREDYPGVDARVLPIPAYKDVFGFDNYAKGGNKFDLFSRRSVLELDRLCGGTDVYFYHANASHHAKYLVTWVAEHLRQRTAMHGYPFLLMGDLNCDPNELDAELMYYDHPALKGPGWSNQFRTRVAGVTHHARHLLSKTLDFGIGSAEGAATMTSWDTRCYSKLRGYADHPDHCPIVVNVG